MDVAKMTNAKKLELCRWYFRGTSAKICNEAQ